MLPEVTSIWSFPPGRASILTALPHQRSALSGSTRSSQTVSGLAAISISWHTSRRSVVLSMLLPLLSFGLALERLEPVAPELVEELLQLGEPLGASTVEPPGAVASFVHEPGLPQDGQMLGDG